MLDYDVPDPLQIPGIYTENYSFKWQSSPSNDNYAIGAFVEYPLSLPAGTRRFICIPRSPYGNGTYAYVATVDIDSLGAITYSYQAVTGLPYTVYSGGIVQGDDSGKMFFVGRSSGGTSYWYKILLTQAFNFVTAYSAALVYQPTGSGNNNHHIQFSREGTTLYELTTDGTTASARALKQFALTGAYDLSSPTLVHEVSGNPSIPFDNEFYGFSRPRFTNDQLLMLRVNGGSYDMVPYNMLQGDITQAALGAAVNVTNITNGISSPLAQYGSFYGASRTYNAGAPDFYDDAFDEYGYTEP
jgi:hypothetical protein